MELDSAIAVISRWSSTSGNMSYVFTDSRDEIDQYLQAIDQIQCSMVSGTADDRSRANTALRIAMLKIANEMCNILKINCKSADNPDSSTTMTDSGSNSYVDDYIYVYGNALSEVVINDLRSIVQRMNGAGYLEDCKTAYISNRNRCIDAVHLKLEIEKLSSKDAREKEWKMLEPTIKVWARSSKIYFRKIFAYEKQLSEKIFRDVGDDIDVDCFLNISNDYAFQLLEFATNLSCIQIASERLFGILELYKALSDLVPHIYKLFSTNSSELLRKKSEQTAINLAGVACKTFQKFERDLLSVDLSQHRNVAVDMTIHSFCTYVMKYVVRLCENKQTLMELSLSNTPADAGRLNMGITEPQVPFHVMWIITRLVSRVEEDLANKLYKSKSDNSFFLMNNFFYIVQKINKNPQVKEMIGDECFNKVVCSKFDQAKAEFLRLALERVLRTLGDRISSKKKLKSFNREFKKLQIHLGKLRVSDLQLRTDIRVYMEEMLVPSYSSLFQQLSAPPHDPTVLTVEQLQTAILGFFHST